MMGARTIGATTLNWNGNPFLVPHLRMLREAGVDQQAVIQGSAPWPNYRHTVEHDGSSAAAVAEGFAVVPAVVNDFCSAIRNQAASTLDCDVALLLDGDMFLAPHDLRRLLDFIRYSDFDLFRMNYRRCCMNYYGFDFRYGARDSHPLTFDAIAVARGLTFSKTTYIEGLNPCVIEWPDFTVHHFTGWKGWPSAEARAAERVRVEAAYVGRVWTPAPAWLQEMIGV